MEEGIAQLKLPWLAMTPDLDGAIGSDAQQRTAQSLAVGMTAQVRALQLQLPGVIKVVVIQEGNPFISGQFHANIPAFTHAQVGGVFVNSRNAPEFLQFTSGLGRGMVIDDYYFGGRRGLRSNGS
jgi:hypothetical protein